MMANGLIKLEKFEELASTGQLASMSDRYVDTKVLNI